MRHRGFTVIELMIVITILGILGVVAVGASGVFRVEHVDEQNAQVEQYAAEMGYTLTGKHCQTADSDGDGYVSCDVNIKTKDGQEKTLALDCATTRGVRSYYSTGCRVSKGRGVNNVNVGGVGVPQ